MFISSAYNMCLRMTSASWLDKISLANMAVAFLFKGSIWHIIAIAASYIFDGFRIWILQYSFPVCVRKGWLVMICHWAPYFLWCFPDISVWRSLCLCQWQYLPPHLMFCDAALWSQHFPHHLFLHLHIPVFFWVTPLQTFCAFLKMMCAVT